MFHKHEGSLGDFWSFGWTFFLTIISCKHLVWPQGRLDIKGHAPGCVPSSIGDRMMGLQVVNLWDLGLRLTISLQAYASLAAVAGHSAKFVAQSMLHPKHP